MGEETFDSKDQKVRRFYFNSHGILYYEKERGTYHPKTVVSSSVVGGTKAGGDEIRTLFGEKLMSFPKPSGLIKFLTKLVCQDANEIILDFFAGSATTAHAVIQLNAEDGGKRKFIMVQLPEACSEKTEAFKAGYKTIAEIGKERIRRVGAHINAECATVKKQEENSIFDKLDNPPSPFILQNSLDTGFRVLKLDSSNMADVYYTPDLVEQEKLELFTDNIKDNRSSEDILFQVLLDWGIDLSLPLTTEVLTIVGKEGHEKEFEVSFVDGNTLAACFEKDGKITEAFCKELAERQPFRVVFRDSGFKDDSVKINVKQIFKLMSPHTDVKTI